MRVAIGICDYYETIYLQERLKQKALQIYVAVNQVTILIYISAVAWFSVCY